MQATLLVETINTDAFTVFIIMLQIRFVFFLGGGEIVIKTVFSYAAFILTTDQEIQK